MRVSSVIFISILSAACTGCSVQSSAHKRHCDHSELHTLPLDYTGVRSVAFVSTAVNRLHITGSATPDASISARACAASTDALKQLTLRQERQGERLTVTLEHTKRSSWSWFGRWFGSEHAWFVLDTSIPADLAVEIDVEAGDLKITGVATLSSTVAVGNLDVSAIAGEVAIRRIGAGNVELDGIGSLSIDTLGAGNVEIKHVDGAVRIGEIGAGNIELDDAQGDVTIGSIGTGNVEIEQVRGSVSVGSIGVGSLEVNDISGDLRVQSKGIGSIHHQRVGGTVELP